MRHTRPPSTLHSHSPWAKRHAQQWRAQLQQQLNSGRPLSPWLRWWAHCSLAHSEQLFSAVQWSFLQDHPQKYALMRCVPRHRHVYDLCALASRCGDAVLLQYAITDLHISSNDWKRVVNVVSASSQKNIDFIALVLDEAARQHPHTHPNYWPSHWLRSNAAEPTSWPSASAFVRVVRAQHFDVGQRMLHMKMVNVWECFQALYILALDNNTTALNWWWDNAEIHVLLANATYGEQNARAIDALVLLLLKWATACDGEELRPGIQYCLTRIRCHASVQKYCPPTCVAEEWDTHWSKLFRNHTEISPAMAKALALLCAGHSDLHAWCMSALTHKTYGIMAGVLPLLPSAQQLSMASLIPTDALRIYPQCQSVLQNTVLAHAVPRILQPSRARRM